MLTDRLSDEPYNRQVRPQQRRLVGRSEPTHSTDHPYEEQCLSAGFEHPCVCNCRAARHGRHSPSSASFRHVGSGFDVAQSLARLLGLPPTLALVAATTVLTGVVLRLFRLVENRSLEFDEALISLNIINKSFRGLFGQLDNNSGAPVGFLVIEKAFASIMGPTEVVLRLWPFLAGSTAVVLFALVAGRFVSPRAAVLAIGLLSLGWPLIAYSATVKQYSTDVAASAGLLLLSTWVIGRPLSWRLTALLGVVGGALVSLSHPSVFIFVGLGFVLAVDALVGRRWPDLTRLAALVAIWLVALGLLYVVTLRNLADLQQSFRGAYPLDSEHSLRLATTGTFRFAIGIPPMAFDGFDLGDGLTAVALAFCAVGAVTLFQQAWQRTLLLVLPAALAFGAAAFGAYPLIPRTGLFLAPAAILLVAQGVVATAGFTVRRLPRIAVAAGALALCLATISWPIGALAGPRIRGEEQHVHDEIAPAMDYLARWQRGGDSVYLRFETQYAFRYYLECGCGGINVDQAIARRLWPVRLLGGGPGQWAPVLATKSPGSSLASIMAWTSGDTSPN